MTVCIGAICENGEKVVVAADRMSSVSQPIPVVYEATRAKIIPLTSYCVLLASGVVTTLTEFTNYAKPRVQRERSPKISRIAQILAGCYEELRKREVDNFFLKPRNLSFETFYRNFHDFPQEFASKLDEDIWKYKYPLELLIAGVDPSGGHLYLIYNPGVEYCFDEIGHCEVGEGAPHAKLTFMSSGYSKDLPLPEVIYMTYEAKKRAESAPHVGEKTDMAVITKKGTIPLDPLILKKLGEIYEEAREAALQKVRSSLKTLDDLLRE